MFIQQCQWNVKTSSHVILETAVTSGQLCIEYFQNNLMDEVIRTLGQRRHVAPSRDSCRSYPSQNFKSDIRDYGVAPRSNSSSSSVVPTLQRARRMQDTLNAMVPIHCTFTEQCRVIPIPTHRSASTPTMYLAQTYVFRMSQSGIEYQTP